MLNSRNFKLGRDVVGGYCFSEKGKPVESGDAKSQARFRAAGLPEMPDFLKRGGHGVGRQSSRTPVFIQICQLGLRFSVDPFVFGEDC